MGEALQPAAEDMERAPVAADEVEVATEQPEATGRWFPALLGSRRNIGAEANAEAEPARDDAVGSVEVAGKLAGRPPPPAPADLYTGPRSDGLLMRAGPYKVQSCPGRVAVTEKYTSSSAAYAPHRTRRIKRVHWHHNLKGIMPTDRRLVERYPANDGHEPIFLSLAGGGGVGN